MTGKRDKGGDLIDENLRRVYQTVLEEDIPDRFKDLLDQLQAGKTLSTEDGSSNK